MSNTIIIKRSAVANKAPTTANLQLGELAINTFDGRLYLKRDNGVESVISVGQTMAIATDATVTAAENTTYLVESTTTLNLPTSPVEGCVVGVADHGADFGLNPITIVPAGGSTIAGESSLTLDSTNATATLAYGNNRWSIINAESFIGWNPGGALNNVEEFSHTGLNTGAGQALTYVSAAVYRTVKYIVQVEAAGDFQSTEVLVLHNDTTAYASELHSLLTNGALASFSAILSSGNLTLTATVNQDNTTIKGLRLAVSV